MACAQLLCVLLTTGASVDEDVGARGGIPKTLASVGALGGKAGELRDSGVDLPELCACPGQAAPDNGVASCILIARAAEIALRLAEPRIRGVGGEARL